MQECTSEAALKEASAPERNVVFEDTIVAAEKDVEELVTFFSYTLYADLALPSKRILLEEIVARLVALESTVKAKETGEPSVGGDRAATMGDGDLRSFMALLNDQMAAIWSRINSMGSERCSMRSQTKQEEFHLRAQYIVGYLDRNEVTVVPRIPRIIATTIRSKCNMLICTIKIACTQSAHKLDLTYVKKNRGRPKKTWLENIKNDISLLDLNENLTLNRTQSRKKIHVADPT
ncbi:hypothetical protein IEQ34_006986 [Dendrobium chrysotoxum]|uniref:Uncharacterized protein n=1 Tax=Dendrobium chrysotoxum TaxID=161865 RepID=A0AAV7H830_DENCH|nr:hypothetical protein IEQ34_006986 [Dendrobium chrysotoxum]